MNYSGLSESISDKPEFKGLNWITKHRINTIMKYFIKTGTRMTERRGGNSKLAFRQNLAAVKTTLLCSYHQSYRWICNVSERVQFISKQSKRHRQIFKSSVILSDTLRHKQTGSQSLKLILEVKTRWNSVYYMLQIYIVLAPIAHQILMLNTKAPPTPLAIEMQHIKTLICILKPWE